MITRDITITKEYGADIIPYLVQSACHYNCSLYIKKDSLNINMKSIMGMTILQLNKNDVFTLVADGDDENKAAEDIAGCFE